MLQGQGSREGGFRVPRAGGLGACQNLGCACQLEGILDAQNSFHYVDTSYLKKPKPISFCHSLAV